MKLSRGLVFQFISILLAVSLLVLAIPLWLMVMRPATEADAMICPHTVITEDDRAFVADLLPSISDCKTADGQAYTVSDD